MIRVAGYTQKRGSQTWLSQEPGSLWVQAMGTGWCQGQLPLLLIRLLPSRIVDPVLPDLIFFNADHKWSCYMKLSHSAMLAVNSN